MRNKFCRCFVDSKIKSDSIKAIVQVKVSRIKKHDHITDEADQKNMRLLIIVNNESA